MTGKTASRAKAGLLIALIPFGFTVGLIVYGTERTDAPAWLLTLVALAGAAVPVTISLFAVSRRPGDRGGDQSP